MDTASVIDRALCGPALVFGSPPPGGRDLDLLAGPGELAVLESLSLPEVEAVAVGEWGAFGADVMARSLSLDPWVRLRRPEPADAVLIAAWRLRRDPSTPPEKLRRRVAAATAEDPAAWSIAEGRAARYGLGAALAALRGLADGGR